MIGLNVNIQATYKMRLKFNIFKSESKLSFLFESSGRKGCRKDRSGATKCCGKNCQGVESRGGTVLANAHSQ